MGLSSVVTDDFEAEVELLSRDLRWYPALQIVLAWFPALYIVWFLKNTVLHLFTLNNRS